MSGRGRGRGKMSFSAEQLGFGKGEALPPPTLQPPPTYPPLGFFPSPLLKSPEQLYMGARLGDQRKRFQTSSFYILADTAKSDVERYSDRFQAPKAKQFKYDLSYMPSELRPVKKKRKKTEYPIRQALKVAREARTVVTGDIEQKLKVLEETEGKAESEEEEEEAKSEEKEKEDEGEEEVEDEEELEEETDYISAYFDNGEGYLDDDDDKVDDGPVY